MSHSTTSGGGRVTAAVARDASGSRRPGAGWRGWCGAGRSTGPSGSGRSRRVRRRSSGRIRRRISRLAAAISAALIASKSICCSRSWSDTVSTASCTGGSSSGVRLACAAGRTPRRRGGCRRRRVRASSPSARRAAPSPRPVRAAVGSRQNSAKAWSNTSWCSWRCTIAVRSAVRACALLPRSTSVSACCAGQRLGRPDRQPGAAQQAGEVHDVGGKGGRRCHVPGTAPAGAAGKSVAAVANACVGRDRVSVRVRDAVSCTACRPAARRCQR